MLTKQSQAFQGSPQELLRRPVPDTHFRHLQGNETIFVLAHEKDEDPEIVAVGSEDITNIEYDRDNEAGIATIVLSDGSFFPVSLAESLIAQAELQQSKYGALPKAGLGTPLVLNPLGA